MTLATVVIGISTAAIVGRKLLSNLKNVTGRFSRLELAAVAVLLMAYFGLAFVPLYVFG